MDFAHIWNEHHWTLTANRKCSSLNQRNRLSTDFPSLGLNLIHCLYGLSRSKKIWVFDFLDHKPAMVTYFSLLFNILKKGAFILRKVMQVLWKESFLIHFWILKRHSRRHTLNLGWMEWWSFRFPASHFLLSATSSPAQSIWELLYCPRSCHGHLHHSCFPTPLHLANSLPSSKMQFK